MIAAALGAMLALASASFAQQGAFGTADEAKAMLMKAVAAVKADKAKGLDMIARVEGGFRDRDLYPTLKDPKGFNFGQVIFETVTQKPEGQISEVSGIMLPKPGSDPTPVPKTVFVTKVGDLGCGVGYYN
jgi:hypothetical protein